ncbi:MAG TPA: HEAT repeat domain-containing protein, partial [Burkholderiales bacterium]|nr:HEAT repeat domain-containing protein [Burkholderiales bacterium]
MKKTRIPVLIVLVLLAAAAAGGQAGDAAGLAPRVTALLSRFPAANGAERDALAAEVLKLGPAAVAEICRRVLPPGGGDDTTVRFALNGVVVYAARSGAEQDRLLAVRAILDAVRKAADKDVRAFLISQVQLAGKAESIKPLAVYLTDERLAEPAAQALLAVRAPGVEAAFLKALDAAPGAARVTVVKALGELRSREAAKKLIPLASSPDDSLRQTALVALANIGDPAAGPALERARLAAPLHERSEAPVLYLLYARRLVESGRAAEGLAAARAVLRYYTDPSESHVAASALGLIVAATKDRALPDLLAAMDSPSAKFRGAALELAGSIPGSEAAAEWVKKAASVSAEAQAEIVTMLGRRGDRSALAAVREALRSPALAVRLAAIPAAVRLGGADVLPEIYPF